MKKFLLLTLSLCMAIAANAQDIPYSKYLSFSKKEFKENNFKEWDYIELYITQSNMTNEIYLKKINEYTKSYKNVWVIPMSNDNNIKDDVKFEGYDIESVINECIPKELEEKFNQIKERLNGNI